MIKYFLPLLFWSASGNAQLDSTFKQVHLENELTVSSAITNDGKYYQYFTTTFNKGDVLLLQYISKDFEPQLFIQNAVGMSITAHARENTLLYSFRPEPAGTYTFIFTSKWPSKTGKFSIDKVYFNSIKNTVTEKSSFCDKLNFTIKNAETGFELMKLSSDKASLLDKFVPNIQLIPGTECFISQVTYTIYHCIFKATTDLAGLKTKLLEFDRSISTCITDHTRIMEDNKNNGLPMIKYERKGSNAIELDKLKPVPGVKDVITLKITRSDPDQYQLVIEIE